VLSIFLVLAGLFAGTFLASLSGASGSQVPVSAGLISGLYIIIAVVYFLLSLYLFRFAVKMKTALASNDQDVLNGSFQNLKIVYRIMGIIMIIYLGIIALAIVGMIGTAAMR
jgi:heme/copper-type cytochrome/quinol oxidase subunit 2